VEELVDPSINQTLVRSLMTSITTVLAIIPLIELGGDTIRQFAIPLMIGIICGAASSIFVSSPVFYELNRIAGRGGRGRGGRYSAVVTPSKSKSGAGNTGFGAKGQGKKSKSKRTSSSGGAVV
jgi:predicted RND superfamily exporter protein